MLEVEEAGPEFRVILSIADPECGRLLAILFDGFGYRVLECPNAASLEQRLLEFGDIRAAVVDLGLPGVEDICSKLREHAATPILALYDDDLPDAEALSQRLHCDALERLRAEPESWITALRRLVLRDVH
ncbi:MAG: response regulator transcription factor [Myxococcales bacterium]|nr:response regulator transcription factor [Myxococcales bacterium]